MGIGGLRSRGDAQEMGLLRFEQGTRRRVAGEGAAGPGGAGLQQFANELEPGGRSVAVGVAQDPRAVRGAFEVAAQAAGGLLQPVPLDAQPLEPIAGSDQGPDRLPPEAREGEVSGEGRAAAGRGDGRGRQGALQRAELRVEQD